MKNFEIKFEIKNIRSMYVKKDGTLYVQVPNNFPEKRPIKITSRDQGYTVKGDIISKSKSGLILSRWKIIN